MNRKALLVLTLLSGLAADATAQQTIIAPSRSVDWSKAGVQGGIQSRSTVCATLSPGATAAQINSAISSCPAGQVVKLDPGTFNLSSGIAFSGKSNVTLRGAGPDATFLVFTGNNNCSGKNAGICVSNSAPVYPPDGETNQANWTAGYAQGATSITLGSKTNLVVGSTIILDQNNDNDLSDPGNDVFSCTTSGCVQNGGPSVTRDQYQLVTVTSISGAGPYTVGISPGLYMPNWRANRSPHAWWGSPFVTGVGIEDLSITYSSAPAFNFSITFFNAQHSWMKNVRSVRPYRGGQSGCGGGTGCSGKHVLSFVSHHITVRDSYFFDSTAYANDSYGFNGWYSSDNLVENNIFQRMSNPMMNEDGNTGSVYAYNYSLNGMFGTQTPSTPTDWMQASSYFHGPGSGYILWEGNDGSGVNIENYFGLAFFTTAFRNRWSGWEQGGLQNQTVAIHNYARNRFGNFVGNVLGTAGYHNAYQTIAASATTHSGGSDCVHSVFAIGLGWNCNDGNGTIGRPPNDLNTLPTILRWGNFDTVSAATRFVASEIPSGISLFATPVPGSQALPASFYLSGRPGWWGSMPFPAIGPDVSGGDVVGSGTSVNAGLGGHVYRIPARLCFENVLGGTFNDTTARTFNASSCYSSSPGGSSGMPSAPSNLRITSGGE